MIITLLVAGSLFAFSYATKRDPLFPGAVVSLTWALTALVYSLQPFVPPLSVAAEVLVSCGTAAFVLGCLTVSGVQRQRKAAYVVRFQPPNLLLGFLAVCAAIIATLFVLKGAELATSGLTDNVFMNVRYAIVQEDGYGQLEYAGPITVVVGFAGALRMASVGFRKAGIFSVLAIMSGFVVALMSTGRGILLQYLIAIAMPYVFLRGASWRLLVLGTGTFAVLFLVIGAALNKVEGLQMASRGPIDVGLIVKNVCIYLVGGVNALNVFVEQGSELAGGKNSLRFFVAVLNTLGIGAEEKKLVEEFVYASEATNVYSYYYPYFTDFGMLFAVAVQFPLGALYGRLYTVVRRDGPSALPVFMFSSLLFPLIMQFQQEYLIVSLSLWLQYFFWAFCIFHLHRWIRRSGPPFHARSMRFVE